MLHLGNAKLAKSYFANDKKKILSSHQERHRSLQSVLMLEIVPLYTHSKLVAKE